MEAARHNQGKPEYSQMPVDLLNEIFPYFGGILNFPFSKMEGLIRVFEQGQVKYSRGNYRKGFPLEKSLDCAWRHAIKLQDARLSGNESLNYDVESKQNHIYHVIWNLMVMGVVIPPKAADPSDLSFDLGTLGQLLIELGELNRLWANGADAKNWYAVDGSRIYTDALLVAINYGLNLAKDSSKQEVVKETEAPVKAPSYTTFSTQLDEAMKRYGWGKPVYPPCFGKY